MRLQSIIAAINGILLVLGAGLSSASGAPAGEACSLLTQAEVSAVLGVAMAAGQRIVASSSFLCGWSEPGGATVTNKRVVLSITNPDRFAIGKTPVTGVTKTPVGGIGDEAYYTTASGLGTTLSVKRGSAAFNISVKGGFSVDRVKAMEKTLAQEVLAKL